MARDPHEAKTSLTITLLTVKLILPGCGSLKEKRGLLKPLLARLHKEFTLTAAEIGLHDVWQSAWIGCVVLSNDADHNSRVLHQALEFAQSHFPWLEINEHHIETI
jgi:uncharacterized protein YlxP (DUF503 family)